MRSPWGCSQRILRGCLCGGVSSHNVKWIYEIMSGVIHKKERGGERERERERDQSCSSNFELFFEERESGKHTSSELGPETPGLAGSEVWPRLLPASTRIPLPHPAAPATGWLVRVPQTVPAPVPVLGIRSPNLCRREAELAACRLLRKPTGTPKRRLGGRAGEDSEGSHGCPLNHSSAMGKPKEGERARNCTLKERSQQRRQRPCRRREQRDLA
ncbi:uncharacterized protein LOC121471802 [Vulpes lagopus]|uniref:uncharacterized protein LOC121471802 n=1 Tax=Vulpes lagopus TaxID=494514 RepID=UPI001BC9E5AB|nr:uncharacterized protein LOC121471802 [Vulpes lagopus]